MSRALLTGLLLIGAFGLAACERGAVAEVKQAVAAQQRDPDSAKFTDVRQGRENWVCGLVNGKNAFGAYAGPRRFVGLGKDFVAIEPEPDSPMRDLFEENWTTCTGQPRPASLAETADTLERVANTAD